MEFPNPLERVAHKHSQEGLATSSRVEFFRRLGQQLEEHGSELMEGFDIFWHKAQRFYEQYWDTKAAELGKIYRKTDNPFFYFDQKEELEFLIGHTSREILKIVARKAVRDIYLAFDIYTCIQGLQPDRVVSLVNGAVRMAAIANALGVDSENYLSVHRTMGDDHKKVLSAEPIYLGKPIEKGSRVLLLEDTSSLGVNRTYQQARDWLKRFGVSDVPVFLEFVDVVNPSTATGREFTDAQFIQNQEELNRENCYNSFNKGAPNPDSSFWVATKSTLSAITEQNPNLYDSFFELIKSMETEAPGLSNTVES